MNCREFEEKLPYLVAGQAPRFVLAAAEEHALACPRCARLRAAAAGLDDAPIAPPPEDLVAAILSATGGPTCARIEEQLAGWADDALEPGDRALLAEHLAHCSACREVTQELACLRRELPLLREIEPDAGFVADVLASTSGAEASARRRAAHAGGSRWRRFWDRPQAALELAYVGAFVVSLVMTAPSSRARKEAALPATWISETADSLAGQASAEAAELRATALRLRSYLDSPGPHLAALPEPGPIELWFDRGLRLLQSIEVTGRSARLLWTDLLHGRWDDGRQELSRWCAQLRICWSKTASNALSKGGSGGTRPDPESTEPRP